MAKKAFYDNDFRLGILGGGQLGKMLIQASGDLNVSPYILGQDETVPAAGLASSRKCWPLSKIRVSKKIFIGSTTFLIPPTDM
jgi:phosphoribosylaminoimidazole carboxylase (NCAIR synthetase)